MVHNENLENVVRLKVNCNLFYHNCFYALCFDARDCFQLM